MMRKEAYYIDKWAAGLGLLGKIITNDISPIQKVNTKENNVLGHNKPITSSHQRDISDKVTVKKSQGL